MINCLISGERTRRESNSSVIVNVRHRPGRASITPESAIAVVGRSVTLVCQAEPEGFPLPAYRYALFSYLKMKNHVASLH